jgi:hypothetical protein
VSATEGESVLTEGPSTRGETDGYTGPRVSEPFDQDRTGRGPRGSEPFDQDRTGGNQTGKDERLRVALTGGSGRQARVREAVSRGPGRSI